MRPYKSSHLPLGACAWLTTSPEILHKWEILSSGLVCSLGPGVNKRMESRLYWKILLCLCVVCKPILQTLDVGLYMPLTHWRMSFQLTIWVLTSSQEFCWRNWLRKKGIRYKPPTLNSIKDLLHHYCIITQLQGYYIYTGQKDRTAVFHINNLMQGPVKINSTQISKGELGG